jgi:hypothetical protein
LGLEHRYYLIPRPNSFSPEMEQVQLFCEQAKREWLKYPGWVAKADEKTILRRESIATANVTTILSELWRSGIRMSWPFLQRSGGAQYDLEIHISSQDYIYHTSESIASFGKSVDCRQCSTRLDHGPLTDIFMEARIHAICPKCGTFFDPSEWPATYTDGWTGAKQMLLGGATYRFALMINNMPEEEQENFKVDSQFRDLSKRVFGCNFYDFADFS